MPLTNAEKQARWREKHIAARRDAQRIVGLLVRKRLTEEAIEAMAVILNSFLNRHGSRTLRRALKRLSETPTEEEIAEQHFKYAQYKNWLARWLAQHPGKTAKDWSRLPQAERESWLVAQGKAINAAEQADWEQDHPGHQFPEHECVSRIVKPPILPDGGDAKARTAGSKP